MNGRVAWRLVAGMSIISWCLGIAFPSNLIIPEGFGDKHCYVEVVTDSLELYLSTPASQICKPLQECDFSQWHIFIPVRLVSDLIISNGILCTSWWCSSLPYSSWESARNMQFPSDKTLCKWWSWLIKKLSTSVSADRVADIAEDVGTSVALPYRIWCL